MKDELESIGRWIRDAWGTWAAIAGFIAVAAGFVRWLRQQGQARENIPRARFAYRNTFIDRVWRQRIVIGLERSLRHKVEMQLVGRNTPELIRLNYSQIAAKPGEIMSIDQAFAKSGRQLIIAGPPGSGKTTEALKLIRWLLEEARHDTSAPVPELFQLASWAKKRGPLAEWLADEVQRRHGGNRRDRLALIVHQQVAPVLDGLDEVAQEHRADCVQAINKFWEQYRDVPLVVCSRLTEYEQLSERIKLGGAVTVRPPGADQIDAFLRGAGRRWDAVRAELKERKDSPLLEVLGTPLMLSVAVLSYQKGEPSELLNTKDRSRQRERLWARYVSTMVARGYDPLHTDALDREARQPAPYSERQVVRWLGWLAHAMREKNETELWIHEWMGSSTYRVATRLLFSLLAAVSVRLVIARVYSPSVGRGIGLFFLVIWALLLSTKPAYRAPLTPGRLRVAVLVGLAGGLAFTLAFALFFQLVRLYDSTVPRAAWPVIVLAFALAWLVVGLTFTLVDLGPDRERVAPGSPSQIIATSGRIALGVGLAAGLTAGLIAPWAARVGGFGRELSGLGVGLTAGLTAAATLAIAFGLGAVIFQYSFRLWLRTYDVSPLRWVTFLDWTTENLLLRGTGPAYSWIHIQLRDYLADRFAETNKNWASAFHGRVTFPWAVGVIVFVVLVLVWFFFLLGTKW